jgi:hypothetical protein
MKVVIDFGRFRLELGDHAPGEADTPLWLYNNDIGDGFEINTEDLYELLQKYYVEHM